MRKQAQSIPELIGNTPIVELQRIASGLPGRVCLKLESANPGGSVKDRIARSMIEAAEAEGRITAGSVLIEPTSGNTGVGLAMVCAARGYRIKLVMPESMSRERRMILTALGAEIVLTPGTEGMIGAVEAARELVRSDPRLVMLQQFENPANPEAHRRTTAPEILEQTGGGPDAFVAGVGTGGTITGVGEVLCAEKPGTQIVAVEPAESPVLSGGDPGPHSIQGLGAGFVPAILNREVIDEVLTVPGELAKEMSRRLAREEGIFAGISTGANVVAACRLAAREEFCDKTILTIACDTGERYLSPDLYA